MTAVPSQNPSRSTILDFGIRAPDPKSTGTGSQSRKHRNRTALSQHDLRWIFALLASRHAAIAPTFAGIRRKTTADLIYSKKRRNHSRGSLRRDLGAVCTGRSSHIGLSVLCSKSGLGRLSRDSALLCHITAPDRSTGVARCPLLSMCFLICPAALAGKAWEGCRCYHQRRRGSGAIIQRDH